MYQTTIAYTDGLTATDTNGTHLKIAGSAPVQAGKKVWTDGKIVYGNVLQGGTSFIPVSDCLIYVDHAMNLYKIQGDNVLPMGKAQNYVIGGNRAGKYKVMGNEFILSGRINPNGEALVVSSNGGSWTSHFDGNSEESMKGWTFNFFESWFDVVDERKKSVYLEYANSLGLCVKKADQPLGYIALSFKAQYYDSMTERLKKLTADFDGRGKDQRFYTEGRIKVRYCHVNEDSVELLIDVFGRQKPVCCLKKDGKYPKQMWCYPSGHARYSIEDFPGADRVNVAGGYTFYVKYVWCGDYLAYTEKAEHTQFRCRSGMAEGDLITKISKDYGLKRIDVKCIRQMYLRYDLAGNLLSEELIGESYQQAYLNEQNLGANPDNVEAYYWGEKQGGSGSNFSMPVDGFYVAYAWDGNNSCHNAAVELENFTWEAPKGMYVESIRKYKGNYYIVLRGACEGISQFAHGVYCVNKEKSTLLEELKESVVYGGSTVNAVPYLSTTDYTSTIPGEVWRRCIPSTMILPSVRNINNLKEGAR